MWRERDLERRLSVAGALLTTASISSVLSDPASKRKSLRVVQGLAPAVTLGRLGAASTSIFTHDVNHYKRALGAEHAFRHDNTQNSGLHDFHISMPYPVKKDAQ